MFDLLQLNDKPISEMKDDTPYSPGLHIDDLTDNTTISRFVRKEWIDLSNPDDENFNKTEFQKEYEKDFLKRPMNLNELELLNDANSEHEFYLLLQNHEHDKEVAQRVKENAPLMGLYTDFVYDPLNLVPGGNLFKEAKLATKLITGAAIGAGYGGAYQYMSNEINDNTGGYLSSMGIGAVLGAGIEGANYKLSKLTTTIGEPEKAVANDMKFYEEGKLPTQVAEKQPWTTPLDNTFDIMTSSPSKMFNEYGLMLAPNTIKAEGTLINAKAAKELLFAKAISTRATFDNAVKLGKKEISGMNIPVKEAQIHQIISDAYFNRFVKENLEMQLKTTKSETEKEMLQSQIEELQRKIDEIDNKYKFVKESGVLETTQNTFKFYQNEYAKTGKTFPKRDWYMTVRWDFDRIDKLAKSGNIDKLYNDFYNMVYYSKQYDEFMDKTVGKGKWKAEEGGVKYISKEEFSEKVAKKIVDNLLASNQKREFMTAVNVNLFHPNTENKAGHEIPIKFRNLNHYYGQDYLNKDLYSNLHHYATQASGVIAIRKALTELKKTKPELYQKLEETIEKHPEKKWKIDRDLHTVIEQTLLDNKQSVPRKYAKAMSDSIRQILGRNVTLNNKDDWMYKAIKFSDVLSTLIFGGGFGMHSVGDTFNSIFVGNLIRGGHLKEAINFIKTIREVRKGIKNPEEVGKLLKEVAAFTETMGSMKIDNLTLDPAVTLSPNKGDKVNSIYDKIVATMNYLSDKQFKVTGMRWVTGTAQATAAFKYVKDFEAIADGAKINDSVLKIMGITHKDAVEIGKALKKAKTVVDGSEIPDFNKFAEIAKQKLEKEVLDDVMKETEEAFIKRSYNARIRAFVRKNEGHYPTSEIKEQLMKDAKQAFKDKKNKIIERVKQSKKYQKRLEEALTDDSRSLLAKFNYGIANAMDLKFIGGSTPRLPSLAATVDNNADYILQALFLKFLKYPLAAYTSMMRYGYRHDKMGLMVGALATTMGMMTLEALRDEASSLITGKDNKYDLDTMEGWMKLAKRGLDYSTALGGVTVPLEFVENALTEDMSRNMTGMILPGMVNSTIKSTLAGMKNGEFTNSMAKQYIQWTPFAHYPFIGDMLYKELNDAHKKGEYESVY